MAVPARAEDLTQAELQMIDAVLQLPGCRSTWVLSLIPGEMAFCPPGAVLPRRSCAASEELCHQVEEL